MNEGIPFLLRCHIRIFQAFGFCTQHFSDNRQKSPHVEKCLRLWAIFLLTFFNVITLVVLSCYKEFLFTTDMFGFFNDVLKIVFGNIAVTFSYLETILSRNPVRNFWIVYRKLQKPQQHNLSNKHEMLNDFMKNRRFIIMFYTIGIMEIIVLGIFAANQEKQRQVVLFWSVFTPFIYVVHLRNMQFVFHIEIIRQELLRLKDDLGLMADYAMFHETGQGLGGGFEEFLRSKMAEKQKTYELIYEMYEHFQNSFGFSMLAVPLMIYVRVLVDSYFGYYCHYSEIQECGMNMENKE